MNSTSNRGSEETVPADRSASRPISFKSVALPAEHGSWSLVSEPILLGLLISPSMAGAALAVAAFSLFLFNRPFKIYWSDRRRGRIYERTAFALRYALIYGVVAIVATAIAVFLVGLLPLAPLAIASPLFAVFIIYDQRPGRHWQAELSAPAAFVAIAAVIALADSMAWLPAIALWGFMVGRAIPAVFFIRARLRLDKGKPVKVCVALLAHVIAVAAVAAFVWDGLLPRTAVTAVILLLARAVWGLSAYRWKSSVKALGFLEMGFGLLAVFLVLLGYRLD